MKLVTFTQGRSSPRAGALVQGGRRVVDLKSAHRKRWKKSSRALASVLCIIEGGQSALDKASETLKGAASKAPQAVLPTKSVRLLAPVPVPPQMRDFLCLEKHLIQAFRAARKVRAQQSPDAAAAMRDMEAKGILAIPEVWYERPIFYHPNRLTVVGPDTN